jgi:hypothetical protein
VQLYLSQRRVAFHLSDEGFSEVQPDLRREVFYPRDESPLCGNYWASPAV